MKIQTASGEHVEVVSDEGALQIRKMLDVPVGATTATVTMTYTQVQAAQTTHTHTRLPLVFA